MPTVDQILSAVSKELFPTVIEFYSVFKCKSNAPKYFDTSWDNERLYQYICLKALNREFPHVVMADKVLNNKTVDLQFILNDVTEVIIEMKRWWSSHGQIEIPEFQKDIQSLQSHQVALKLFLVTTIHPTSQREENINALSNMIGISRDKFKSVYMPLDYERTFEIIGIKID